MKGNGNGADVLMVMKHLYEANTFLQIATAESNYPNAKPWQNKTGLVVYKVSSGRSKYFAPTGITISMRNSGRLREVLIHEFGHFVQWNSFGYGLTIPWGAHHMYDINNTAYAVQEGFAEFLGFLFYGKNPLKPYLDRKKVFKAHYRNKSAKKYILDTNHPKGGKPVNLGEKVEGAFAMLLFRILGLITQTEKSVSTFGNSTEIDIGLHPVLRGNDDFFDFKSKDEREDFVRLIWKPLHDSGGYSDRFINSLRTSVMDRAEKEEVEQILKELNMGQPKN